MDDDILKPALAHWGYGNAPCRLIALRENRVYRIDTASGPVAMRLHRPGMRTQAELISELNWMGMLGAAGLSVPRPVEALDGSVCGQFGDTLVDVISWLDGTSLSDMEPTLETFTHLGETMARMHDVADQWTVPKGFVRPTWNAAGLVGDTPLWGRFWENPTLSVEQGAYFKDFRDHAIRALDTLQGKLDYGLIHADLVSENVLVSGSGLHLIDFDDGGFGFRLFDLATITHRSKRHTNDGKVAAAVLDGYEAHRALDRTHLPLFEALRACSYVGWIVPRLDEPNAKARNTRVIAEATLRVAAVLKDQTSWRTP